MDRRTLVWLLLASAAPAFGQEAFRHGRIRHLEPGVTLQRSSEAAAEEAAPNVPFLPGDRVWTDGEGRVEFQFSDGSLLRLDRQSKLDYMTHEEGRGAGRIVLRLWSGGAYLRTRDDRDAPDFEVETPGGVVDLVERGVYRIDVVSGETRLSVYEGEATLDSGRRRVRIEGGERSYARRGEAPEEPRRFDRGERDAFAHWDDEREDRQSWAGTSLRYVPEDVSPYATELDAYGSWYHQSEIGYVWRPYVGAGWQPYYDGRWVWTAYGWTWVPGEPWGWAPFHYGRWGHSSALGWYWIPGSGWGPAWVSWSIGTEHVGWCPLGHRDRPVYVREVRSRGHAVPRGSVATGVTDTVSTAWVYARRADVGAKDLGKRIVDGSAVEGRDLKVLESPRAKLGRDLQIAERLPGTEAATPRNIRTKPTMGDTVPELRSDPATTIPAPVARRRARDQDRDDWLRYDREREGVDQGPGERSKAAPERDRHPTDTRSPAKGSEAGAREREPEKLHPVDPDRDLLRRFFRPLSEPRRPAPESAAPRKEPRQPDPPRTPPAQEGTKPRKEKDQ